MTCYFLKFHVSTGSGPKGGMTKLHAFWTKKVTKFQIRGKGEVGYAQGGLHILG